VPLSPAARHVRPHREERPRRLTGYPRKAKSCMEIISGVTKPYLITTNINNIKIKREIFIKIAKGMGRPFSFNILSPTSTLHR
jgi:hypothetical protein